MSGRWNRLFEVTLFQTRGSWATGRWSCSSINHPLRMANFDAAPIKEARTEKKIPFIQSEASILIFLVAVVADADVAATATAFYFFDGFVVASLGECNE